MRMFRTFLLIVLGVAFVHAAIWGVMVWSSGGPPRGGQTPSLIVLMDRICMAIMNPHFRYGGFIMSPMIVIGESAAIYLIVRLIFRLWR